MIDSEINSFDTGGAFDSHRAMPENIARVARLFRIYANEIINATLETLRGIQIGKLLWNHSLWDTL